MLFSEFEDEFINEAGEILIGEYRNEQRYNSALPNKDFSNKLRDCLKNLSSSKLGVVALEGDKVVGFICFYGPFDNHFGKVSGAFSPIHGHGVIGENRGKLYSLLYENAAKILVDKGIASHAVALYQHDTEGIESFFKNGFGMRTVDSIKTLNEIIEIEVDDYTYKEIIQDDILEILTLKNRLEQHMLQSPSFYLQHQTKAEDLIQDIHNSNTRYFVVQSNGENIAFLKIDDEAETFITDEEDMMNICGAYVLPEYRGMGVYNKLLIHVMNTLKEEGYLRLGVDYESINPTANYFWPKYFKPYTCGLVRRIDERIILHSLKST